MTTPEPAELRRLATGLDDVAWRQRDMMRAAADELERLRAQVAPSLDLLEAVDNVLTLADCECPHSMRFDRGEHLSGCYLFDLNLAYIASPAAPAQQAPSLTVGERVSLCDAVEALESLDDFARMTVAVDPTGPRELLYRFLRQAQRDREALTAQPAAQAEPDLCQNCGDMAYPGCNSEFSAERACRFWGPGSTSAQAEPFGYLRQTSSAANPPHGWALHFSSKPGDVAIYTAQPAAQAEPVAWQPIETAPKDGTRILLWWAGEVHIGRCGGAGKSRDGGDWWISESRQVFKVGDGRPTHWMPLLAAPSHPPAQGVGLTNTQIDELALREGDYDERNCCWSFNGDPDCRYNLHNFARYVESATLDRLAAQAPAAEPPTDDAKDAARYRWLRDDTDSDWAICEWSTQESDGIGYYRDARAPDIVDAAIDAARAAQPSNP